MNVLKPLGFISARRLGARRDDRPLERTTRAAGTWVLVLFCVAALTVVGCGGKKAPGAGGQAGLVAIQAITPTESDTRTEIAFEGSDAILQYTSFQLTEPLRWSWTSPTRTWQPSRTRSR